MAKIVKLLFFLLVYTNCYADRMPTPPYEKYVDEITNEFVKEMYKKYGFLCEGSGGRTANGVHALALRFCLFRHATPDEARKLLVTAVQMLVDRVNAHEKIRPYLKENPFTWRGADISIAFLNKDRTSTYHLDGSVAYMGFAKGGMIAYDKAELQIKKGVDYIDLNGNREIGKVTEREVFVELFREPYEEALKIVQESRTANGPLFQNPIFK